MKIQWPKTLKILVRFSDVDCLGHVNNAKYFTYMEEGRRVLFEEIPELDLTGLQTRPKQSIVIAHLSCDFKAPALIGDTIKLSLGVSHIGTKSFHLEYELVDDLTLKQVATGKSVQVIFDHEKHVSIPIPKTIVSKIETLQMKNYP